MPDLRTEQRLRQRYNFDVPVKFRVDAGGDRDETFRYAPNIVEFMSWCRRIDNVDGAGYKFESNGTLRLASEVQIETRYDARIVANPLNAFFLGTSQSGFIITGVEPVGRDRYLVSVRRLCESDESVGRSCLLKRGTQM